MERPSLKSILQYCQNLCYTLQNETSYFRKCFLHNSEPELFSWHLALASSLQFKLRFMSLLHLFRYFTFRYIVPKLSAVCHLNYTPLNFELNHPERTSVWCECANDSFRSNYKHLFCQQVLCRRPILPVRQ